MRREARFFVGQLVRHRKYGYRGAIAGWDPKCRADENWYFSNRTQPERGQPWYHVLVHGGMHTTYVAEENLEPYEGGEQVVHPLTRELFASFSSGHYQPREGVEFPAPW
jgi:heat shock protein HspQ